jgi:DNA-binding transcriptional LysR family regulator
MVMPVRHTLEAPCSAAWKQAIAFPSGASAPCTNLVQTPPRTSSISPLDPTVAARPLTSSRICSLAPAAHSLLLRGQHCTATGEKYVLGTHAYIPSYFKCEGDSSRLRTRGNGGDENALHHSVSTIQATCRRLGSACLYCWCSCRLRHCIRKLLHAWRSVQLFRAWTRLVSKSEHHREDSKHETPGRLSSSKVAMFPDC